MCYGISCGSFAKRRLLKVNDPMCVHGYGAKLVKIWPYIDADKLRDIIQDMCGCVIDTGRESESAIGRINRIDIDLVEHTQCQSLDGVFDRLDSSHLTECVGDLRADWFFYLPACMPWQYAEGMPQTQKDADALLVKVLRPLLKDGVTDDEVAAHFGSLNDIS